MAFKELYVESFLMANDKASDFLQEEGVSQTRLTTDQGFVLFAASHVLLDVATFTIPDIEDLTGFQRHTIDRSLDRFKRMPIIERNARRTGEPGHPFYEYNPNELGSRTLRFYQSPELA